MAGAVRVTKSAGSIAAASVNAFSSWVRVFGHTCH
jgi:hypothetical protein